jgi:hypothetical protein
MRKPGDVKLTVTVDQEEIVVNQSIYAGVDGPILVERIGDVGDLDQVDGFLRDNGLMRTDAWKLRKAYNGLHLEAPLTQV